MRTCLSFKRCAPCRNLLAGVQSWQVPCLAYREENGEIHSVYESLICNEFLEEFASPPAYQAIFPHNPAEKAQARIIIDRFDRKFIPNFYGILSK